MDDYLHKVTQRNRSPKKHTITGNFSLDHKLFDLTLFKRTNQHNTLERTSDHNSQRASLRQNVESSLPQNFLERASVRLNYLERVSEQNIQRPSLRQNVGSSLPENFLERASAQNSQRASLRHNVESSLPQNFLDTDSIRLNFLERDFKQDIQRASLRQNVESSLSQNFLERVSNRQNITERDYKQDIKRPSLRQNRESSLPQNFLERPSEQNSQRASLRKAQTSQRASLRTSVESNLPENFLERASLRQNILEEVMKKTESVMKVEENPMYEDPRDVIDKPHKPPRKRNIQAIAVTSPRTSNEHKSLLKDQKRKLTKKYENLINSLMDRCEENIVMISEKDSHITKLKEKLRTVLEYNKLFSDENDQLRQQYDTLVKYVEDCKSVIREERERSRVLEGQKRELEERVSKFEVPDRDCEPPSLVPLVEVCMSCSSRQIILNQAREHCTRLQKDMQAMKDVLYRLNVQLSRYQEKLRTNIHNMADGREHKTDGLDSLITASLGYKLPETTEDGHSTKGGTDEQTTTARLVDLSGLLSAQALAPLFDAYQENLLEKDTLILDYEKQFEIMNKKSKEIVSENKNLIDKVNSLEEEVSRVRQSYKKLVVEKETGDIEKSTLVERAEKAEFKLKEVYELYEDKMSAMMRDYETVHREYFTVKSALEASEGKMAQIDMFRARTVPADLHERRLDHCKRLLEELKHHYGMETDKKADQLTKVQQQMKDADDKYNKLCKDYDAVKNDLDAALKNVRLYRKAAVIFRHRLKSANNRVSRRSRRSRHEPLRQALQALSNIKYQIKSVKSRAHKSLEELEQRILEQENRAAVAHDAHKREIERMKITLQHKESVIRNLLDKLAEYDETKNQNTSTNIEGHRD